MCFLALFSYPYARNSYVHFVFLCTVQLSICEELLYAFWHCSVIHMRGTLMCTLYCSALFNYPYVWNSYVSFWHCSVIHMRGTLMCILLSLNFDNQHMFYIQQVTMSFLAWHLRDDLQCTIDQFMMASIPVDMNIMHLTNLVF